MYIVTLSLYMIFIMASGLAPNIGAQLAFRFLAGLFGSTPLTCAGGSISDLWDPMERVYAFPVFANAAFMGPIFGRTCTFFFPIISYQLKMCCRPDRWRICWRVVPCVVAVGGMDNSRHIRSCSNAGRSRPTGDLCSHTP